jgi:outer membrane protein assembly factor BamB
MAEPSTNDTWHQFHKDVNHTGYQLLGPDSNQIAWTSDTIHAIKDSSLVIADNKVFVNCNGGGTFSSGESGICAVNLTAGIVEWSTALDAQEWGSWSSPAYHDGKVFTSSGQNTTCLYASNGSIIWIFENPTGRASCNGGPAIADGKVFCSDWDGGYYYCLNETNGTLLWNFSTFDDGGSGLGGTRVQGTAAYKDGKVYLTSFCEGYSENGTLKQGWVYCVDAENGTEFWRISLEQNACGSVACGDDGRVYVTTYNFYGTGATYALNASNGSIIWEKETWRTDATPTLAYGNVYVSGGYNRGKTYCFNASTGETVWEAPSIGMWTQSLAVAGGKVYVGKGIYGILSGYEQLYALDAFTGDILWVGDQGGASPAIYDGKLVTITTYGSICCYDGSNAYVDLKPDAPELTTLVLYTDTINKISTTISNLGTINCSDIKVSLLDNWDGSVVEIGNQTLEGLGGGLEATLTFTWTPTEAQAGTHTLYVHVDPQNSIAENNENNNLLPKTIGILSGNSDLQPVSMTPSEIYVNQPYEITATVDNVGFKYSDECKVTIKEGSSIVANVTLPEVAPGMSCDVNFTWTPITSGDITLTVIVDADEEVAEGSETNNELEATITVHPETPIETLAAEDWPQFQNGWLHSGETDVYAPAEVSAELTWSAELSGEYVDVPPIVVDDTVYIYTSEGTLYAYDKDGSYRWSKGLESASIQSCTPAYGDGTVFVASYGGNLSAYDAQTGVKQWLVEVSEEGFESPVTYYDHRIYIGDGLGSGVGTKYFHCYDDLGNHLWSYPNPDSGGFLWNGASVVGDYVVYPTHEGKLVCLDRKNGTLVDEVSLDSNVSTRLSFANETPGLFRSSVVYEDGYVYTTSEQGQEWGFLWKVGFDESNGIFLNDGWSLMQGFSTSTPVIYAGRIYVGQGEHGYSGKLNCVNDSTGEIVWSYDVPQGVKSSPAVSPYYDKTLIYFTSAMDNGSLYCLDGDGALVWEYNPPDDSAYVLQGAAISQGSVYYGTGAGYLYCIEGDWNIFNDAPSASGNLIANTEIQAAVIKWKSQNPLSNGYILSNQNIQALVIKWKAQSPM